MGVSPSEQHKALTHAELREFNSKNFFSQLINFLMEVADEQNNQVGEASYEQPGSTKK
jgi:hypothetical protein